MGDERERPQVSVTIDKEVLEEIDNLRGMVNRSRFAEMLLIKGLKAHKEELEAQKQMAKIQDAAIAHGVRT